MATVIALDKLEKSYDGGKTMILQGVSFAMQQQERVALIGANGSGKSTLLRCLVGLHPLSGGSVQTLGESFSTKPSAQQSKRIRQQIGFVFQQPCLVKRLSVLSNVVHGMVNGQGWLAMTQRFAPKQWRERAYHALEEVQLAHKALERADTLSGGQQQRVAIARALVRRPRLLIADEPAASLDPAAGHEVMALFSRLCQERAISVLFTSHDMEHAMHYAERVIALKAGTVFFDRASQDISAPLLKETFEA